VLCYTIAFAWPSYFFWLVFIFLVPLFYCAISGWGLSFWHGFWWGALFFCLNWYPFVDFILVQGLSPLRYLVVFVLVVYWALHAGLWFWWAQYLPRFFPYKTMSVRIFGWSMTTFFYFTWLTQVVWWPLGRVEGDLFSFPLLPLAAYPRALSLLFYFSRFGLLALLIVWSALCTLLLVGNGRRWIFASLFACLVPFLYGVLSDSIDDKVPPIIEHIAYVSPHGILNTHPMDRAQEITYRLMDCVRDHYDASIIVMPESTYNFSLNERADVVAMWEAHALQGRTLVVGAHRSEGNKLFNTAFMIKDKYIIQHYDKNKLAPFTEKVPVGWRACTSLQHLFLKNGENFCEGKSRTNFECADGFIMTPLLCSELFIGEDIQRQWVAAAYVVLVNDAVFSAPYMRERLVKVAVFKALEFRTNILYVGHFGAVWITHNGTQILINDTKLQKN
jgi:apolipoprotein N-acyltransferase